MSFWHLTKPLLSKQWREHKAVTVTSGYSPPPFSTTGLLINGHSTLYAVSLMILPASYHLLAVRNVVVIYAEIPLHLTAHVFNMTEPVCTQYGVLAHFYRAMLCIRGTSHGPVSVCLSQVGVLSKWLNNRGGFWHVSFLPPSFQLPSFYTVLKGNSVIFKNKGTSLWNFFLNSGLRKFCHSISIVETCYQLSLSKVDAHSTINWAVVSQLSRWYLWAPTLDHFSLSHRSSSAVYSTILSHGSISDSWYLVQDLSYK